MPIDHFSSAGDMLKALDAREISAKELTAMHIERIESRDGPINAIPVRTFERAREAAKHADEVRAAGGTGALLGLPMTLKESSQVAGLPQSAGVEFFAQYQPATDGKIAESVFAAGAALLGKTNIPEALGDWQADSPVYGRTNNPWDETRTPGGSTGGGGAALAAGMTPLEIGSDIGGSIRVPAAYCGVYGHRPSESAVPRSGSFPTADTPNPARFMGVQGPLARTAEDLELLFNVVAGPDHFEDAAWRLELPPARANELSGLRVAVMSDIPGAHASAAMRGRVDELAGVLSASGAKVQVATPQIDFNAYYLDYQRMLSCMTSGPQSREELEASAALMRQSGDPVAAAMADGLTMLAPEYVLLLARRQQAALAWKAFFQDWDLLIGPMALDSAYQHQTGDQNERTLLVDNREVPYISNIIYSMLAIFCGLPSTAFPAGLDPNDLPLGLQAIGPYLEDRTTLRFAQLVERQWYHFEPPRGY